MRRRSSNRARFRLSPTQHKTIHGVAQGTAPVAVSGLAKSGTASNGWSVRDLLRKWLRDGLFERRPESDTSTTIVIEEWDSRRPRCTASAAV